MRLPRIPLVALVPLAAVLVSACAAHEGREPDGSGPVEPAKAVEFRGAIASVALVKDCPDTEPPASPAPTPAARPQDMSRAMPPSESRIAAGAALAGDVPDGWTPPCTQSAMQLTLSHDGREAQGFAIEGVRLLAAGTGAQLATVPFRGPTRWDEAGRYVAWDQQLPAATEIKASYKLGDPDWGMVTRALGNDDVYGTRLVLEVDVAFAGRKITLRSPEFEREREHVIVT